MAHTKRDEFAVKAYAELMAEARIRVDALNKALAGVYKLPDPLLKEFCFLQFRMICELIALACMAAHGDITSGNLREQWAADEIMKRLAELHPAFYPKPMIETRGKPPVRAEFLPFKGDYLTREDLIALTGKCGALPSSRELQAPPH